MGLYFKYSVVLLYIPAIAIYKIIKGRCVPSGQKCPIGTFPNGQKCPKRNVPNGHNGHRYFRYIKLILNSKVILIIIIISSISNGIVLFKNQQYNNLYKEVNTVTGKGIVVSNKVEKEYKNQYKVKIIDINGNSKHKNTYLFLKTDKKSKQEIKYGDEITFSGDFIEPTSRRNFGGFDYKQYLKTIKVFGSINVDSYKVTQHNKANIVFSFSNSCLLKFEEVIDSILEENKAELLKGILLGDSSNIDEDIKEQFRISSISHVLAVSGMHVAYLVIGINFLLKSKAGKNKSKVIIIIFLILYMFITGFSPSVVRACTMEILVLIASLIHRRNDTINSLSLSLILILIYNPFLIMNIGLQFSYIGTIGILFFYNNVLKFLKDIKIRNKKWKYKISLKVTKVTDRVKEILAVTISAQIAIMPIMIYHFNVFGMYFFLTNVIVSVIIGPIIILGLATITTYIIIPQIAKILAVGLSLFIECLIFISNIGELPYSKIYMKTPSILQIIMYYITIVILNFCYEIYNSKKISATRKASKKFNCVI